MNTEQGDIVPKIAEEQSVFYRRMASQLYELAARQAARFAGLADSMSRHLPADVAAELSAASSGYLVQVMDQARDIANGLVAGPRTPPGTRLIWAVRGDTADDYDIRSVHTSSELARGACRSGDETVEEMLLFDRPERKVDFVTRTVLLRHCSAGWWIKSDHTWVDRGRYESAHPLALVDPDCSVSDRGYSQRERRAAIRCTAAGANRTADVDALVDAVLAARWPVLLPGDPDAAVIV